MLGKKISVLLLQTRRNFLSLLVAEAHRFLIFLLSPRIKTRFAAKETTNIRNMVYHFWGVYFCSVLHCIVGGSKRRRRPIFYFSLLFTRHLNIDHLVATSSSWSTPAFPATFAPKQKEVQGCSYETICYCKFFFNFLFFFSFANCHY